MAQVRVLGERIDRAEEILTPEALDFLTELHRLFASRRRELLDLRLTRRAEVEHSGQLDFLGETVHVREAEWQVPRAPHDLMDRRVEITGPAERKMTINALNSGACVWLADLEDASTPHWGNVVNAQVNLFDAVRRSISLTTPDGKTYALKGDQDLATIVMRPRGWHFDEPHLTFDGTPAIGALVDFGLYFVHNAAELLARRSGPYFYLPKTEGHLEARLWNDVFSYAEKALGIAAGSVRATVLIETIPAAFEMDEILFELREHATGLNAGRWDYLFSIIKYFRQSGAGFVMPDRNAVGMTAPFMRAYAELLVQTCHRRGAHAIGGMSAFIPSRSDTAVNQVAFAKVREDKEREVQQGFDGSWVAHPDLVVLCRDVFDQVLGDRPNQLDQTRDDVHVTAKELLDIRSAEGQVTEEGLRNNIEVSLLYLESWLRGNGAVAIHNLMEDAATAEISRSQIWQWVHGDTVLSDGRTITAELVRSMTLRELQSIEATVGRQAFCAGEFAAASRIFEEVALADSYPDFLTVVAFASEPAAAGSTDDPGSRAGRG